MNIFDWFKRQNLAVKSLVGVFAIWGLIVYIPGTIALLHDIRELFTAIGAGQPTKGVPPPPPGSPIIVSGGSLWGGAAKGWQPASSCDPNVTDSDTYCAAVQKTSRGDVLLLSGAYDPALPLTIERGKGWTIHFTDYTPDPHENPKQGVMLCSNAACCPNKKPDPNSNVYIKLFDVNNSVWEGGKPSADGKLYFHDHESGCNDSSDGHGGKCDMPYRATLSIDGQKDQSFLCKDGHNCWVALGCP